MVRSMSPCATNTFGQFTLPEMAPSSPSIEKHRVSAPHDLRDCKAVMIGNVVDPDETNECLIVDKLHIDWSRAPASRLKRLD